MISRYQPTGFWFHLFAIIQTCAYLHWHKCRSRQFFGVAKDFCPKIPQLARNDFVRLWPTNCLSPTKIMKNFFGVTSKKGLHAFFLQMLCTICWSQTTMGAFLLGFSAILPRFSGMFPGFLTNQNFYGRPCTPTTPPPIPNVY